MRKADANQQTDLELPMVAVINATGESSRQSTMLASWALSLGIVALYLAVALVQIRDPLHLDNFDFPAVAYSTLRTGLPRYYRGEDLPNLSGLYHPPLYIYTLAGWFGLTGFGPGQARLLSVLGALLAAMLALRGYARMFGRTAAYRIAPWFLTLYLLNPFALQCFAIADIDTSVLPGLFVGTIACCLGFTFEKASPRTSQVHFYEWVALFLWIYMSFWSKLTTPLLLPPLVAILLSLRYGILGGFSRGALVSGLAILCFVASYITFGRITGLDVSFTWQFLVDSFVSKSAVSGSALSRLSVYATRVYANFKGFGRWDLYLVLALSVICTTRCLKQLRQASAATQRRSLSAIAILASALTIILFYAIITLPFSGSPFKYAAPAWPLLCIAAAHVVNLALAEVPPHRSGIIWAASLVGFVWGLMVLQDRSISGDTNFVWLQYVPPIVAALIISKLGATYSNWNLLRGITHSILMLILIGWFSGTSAGRMLAQAQKPYAKQYDYGQTGFEATRDWLTVNTTNEEVLFSMKDIASSAQRRYLESYGYILGASKFDEFERRLNQLKVRVLIFTDGHGQDPLSYNKQIENWVRENTRQVEHFGDYRIFVRFSRQGTSNE